MLKIKQYEFYKRITSLSFMSFIIKLHYHVIVSLIVCEADLYTYLNVVSEWVSQFTLFKI